MQHSNEPVIIIGAGLSGVATALRLAEFGRSSIILERAAKVGGASAYSAGQVWIPANHLMERHGLKDSVEDGIAYVRSLAHNDARYLDEDAMTRWLQTAPEAARHFESAGCVEWSIIPGYPDYFYPDTPGSRAAGRYLSAAFDARALGVWRDRVNVSPHFPVGTTYAELFGIEDDEAIGYSAFGSSGSAVPEGERFTFGTGVFASFLARALRDERIEFRLGHRVTALRTEAGRVIGVEVDSTQSGYELTGDVVVATSGFDWDEELVSRFWGLDADNYGSIAPRSIAGDGIRLCESAGAAIIEMPRDHIPMVPGYPDPTGRVAYRAAMEHCMPHTFIVNRDGHRFCSDDMYWELVGAATKPDSELPFFMIWDDQHHQKYGLGDTPPGGSYPPQLVQSARSLEELGRLLGVDGQQLDRTAQIFNRGGANATDPQFGRGTNATWRMFAGDPTMPNPNYGPVCEPPYFGMRLVITGNAIGMSGISVDVDCHALDRDGVPIDGLHVVGSAAAFTTSGTGYNSGYALSRAITFAYLVGREIALGPVAERVGA